MTLGFAPLSVGPSGSTPAPASTSGAPQVSANAPTLFATGRLGTAVASLRVGALATGVAAQGRIGQATGGPSTVVGTGTILGVSASASIGTPQISGRATAYLTSLTASGRVGIQASPYTPPATPDVILTGVTGTMGVLAQPTVQAWEFDVAAANADLWVPVPTVTGTAQP